MLSPKLLHPEGGSQHGQRVGKEGRSVGGVFGGPSLGRDLCPHPLTSLGFCLLSPFPIFLQASKGTKQAPEVSPPTHCAQRLSRIRLCDPVDCSPPGSSVHGIFQAGILGWVAISAFGGSSQPRDQTHVSCVSCIGRRILYH